MLNDSILEHLSYIFGTDNYRRYCEGLLKLPLKSKLDYIIPLATHNEFVINEASKTYKNLTSLISIRNRLTHNKSYPIQIELEKMDFPVKELEELKPYISLDYEYCFSVFEALKDIYNILDTTARIAKNDGNWQESNTIIKNNNTQ